MQKVPETTRLPLALIVVIGVVCLAGISVFVFRHKIFPEKPSEEQAEAESGQGENRNPPAARTGDAGTNRFWMLELTNAVAPDVLANGKISGRDFSCDRSTFAMQNGQLTLRSGYSGPVDFGINIFFFVRTPQELSGRKIQISTNDAVAPRVVLRWRDSDQPVTETFNGGYSMNLQFGQFSGNSLPGKIYICLPDTEKSYVVGTFNAEIRKPPAPKPPKPRR